MSDELQADVTPKPSDSPKTFSKKKGGGLLVSIIISLWAFWMGWSGGKEKLGADTQEWQDKTLAPRIAVLRQQLSTIEGRPVSVVDDYISNTLETEPIVNEAQGLNVKQMLMITRFKMRYSDNSGDAKVADYMMKLTRTDAQLMSLLAEEIQCAKDLRSMPAAKRLGYYNATVPAIKDKEEETLKEYYAIAKEAKAQGVPLPADTANAVPQSGR